METLNEALREPPGSAVLKRHAADRSPFQDLTASKTIKHIEV